MCGEKSAPRITSPVSWGSPPHVRGKGFCAVEIHCCCGITPACAGKSGTVGAVGNAIGDHPRMCGEKAAFQRLHLAMLGSPPHVRGKALFIKNHFPFVGITPACAGKRCTCCYACPRPTDHPRTCGEKAVIDMCSCHSLGSPPHMRGKVRFSLPIGPPSGITPAHAGKSPRFRSASQLQWDHPRTCGEKSHKKTSGATE